MSLRNIQENRYITLKTIKNYVELRTPRGTDEAAADNTQSVYSRQQTVCLQQTTHSLSTALYRNIYVSCIFRKLITFIFFCIVDTTKIVLTCDYLYLNKEIHFAKPLTMSETGAGRKTRNKNRVKQA